jgi:hypothetical protein
VVCIGYAENRLRHLRNTPLENVGRSEFLA